MGGSYENTVIVTGTSSGLGLATAKQLLSENYLVIGIDKLTNSIQHKNYHHLEIDLTQLDIEIIKHAITGKQWYSFIHCAGVSVGNKIGNLMIDDWNYSIEVNVTSAMRLCQLADKLMSDGGRIILVSSPVAFAGAKKPSYSASKAALHGLTMSVSRSLGARNICVNTILPGPMITGMTADWSEERRRSIATETRLNRLARPEDVSHVICRMLDNEWSYMSASIIDMTCGSMYGH